MARIINTADLTPRSQLTSNEELWIYNGLDCCVTLEVLEQIQPQLDNVTAGTYAFSKALQAPVMEMSQRGLLVDFARRDQVIKLYQDQLELIDANLRRLINEGVGIPMDWNKQPSPQQLNNLFYDVMGFKPIRKRNNQGKLVRTTNREALEKLSAYFLAEPICLHILTFRDLAKKLGFLQTGIDADGRMRSNFNIAGTNTGRLASSMSDFGTGTNLQNVDRELRSVFCADPGMKFANLDLEQADARNVGAICWNTFVESHGEKFARAYLDACESGDLHTTVCRMAWTDLAWGTDPDNFRAVADQIAYRGLSYRDLAKKLGHGTNYYGLPPTMSRHSKVDKAAIEEFQRNYFAAFPAIGSFDKRDHAADNWHNRVRRAIKNEHQLTTLLGRRRYFFGRYNDDETIRAAIAYEPQSLTSDEINQGILNIWRANRVQLLLQVHDSILFQYPEELEDEIIPWALEALKTPIMLARGREFVVPTEAKVGWNWGDFDKDTNPDGLVKWKGHDARSRTEQPGRKQLFSPDMVL